MIDLFLIGKLDKVVTVGQIYVLTVSTSHALTTEQSHALTVEKGKPWI